MLIPLDYYRIIGLPLQATAEQIEQAYQDRLRQTPHSELSQGTLEARKSLLDLAYQVLSDPEQRSEYDANYLLSTYDVAEEETVAFPQIQREEEAVAVAAHTPRIEVETSQQLLAALLILYELGEYQRVRDLGEWLLAHPDRPEGEELSPPMQGDLVLILALSCWELGREFWRQEEYEAAGETVEKGYQTLLDWDLFYQLQSEMAAELDKLCPYRIFELLSQRDVRDNAVARAIELLQGMFEKRGGIDGELPDDSGLNVDEFLHFVQQIREYLTTSEQEELFSHQVQRGVAMYLAGCASLARGFAYLEPYSVLKARGLFRQLETAHGSKGDQADVYLEESICALLLGETEQAIELMEKSQETASIEQIQTYAAQTEESPDLLLGLCQYAEQWLESFLFPKFLDVANQEANLKDYFASESVQQTLESFQEEETPPPEPETTFSPVTETGNNSQRSFLGAAISWRNTNNATDTSDTSPPKSPSSSWEDRRSHRRRKKPLRFQSRTSRIIGLILLTGVGLSVIALVLFGFYKGVSALWSTFVNPNSNRSESSSIALELNAPPIAIPSPPSSEEDARSPLNRATGEQIVRTWLSSKAQALGPQHQASALEEILTDPLLSSWEARSQTFENNNTYQQFRHSVTIESISYPADNSDEGEVIATVREVAKFYRNGNQIPSQSYDSTLKVGYDVVRQNGNWRIKGISIIEEL